MDARVEATPMTVASAMTEPVLIVAAAINNASIVIADSCGLSLVVPSVGGHSISAINPDFMKVGVKAAA
jgi:hypothetical protein